MEVANHPCRCEGGKVISIPEELVEQLERGNALLFIGERILRNVQGETIIDHRSLPEVAPGNYQLLIGWYRAADGTRLPLADGSGDSVTVEEFVIP